MKNILKNIHLYIGFASVALLTSCKPEIESFKPSAGEQANFSKYIAIGNSLTAGFADGGLYLEGQQVAFPNLIATQLQQVGNKSFNSPFFTEDQRNGSGYLRLKALINGQPQMESVTTELAIRGANTEGKPLYTKYTEEIHNYGVPGMRLDMAFAPYIGTAMGNPYFERLLPDNTDPAYTYKEHVTTKDHTFFTFWLGNNDVLGYATNGAVEEDATSKLTDVATFKHLYDTFLNDLTSKEQKGVVATIPDVTAIPYFTTVTRAALLAAVQANAPEVEHLFIETSDGAVRPATDEDLFVLPFSSAGLLGQVTPELPIPYGLHPNNPIASKYVLDPAEIAIIKKRVEDFNNIIKDGAKQYDLAVADAYTFLNQVKSPGIMYNGLGINASFITGNAFSLDGIHLTPLGNALMANLFIETINKAYGSNISKINASNYRGVKLP